MKQKAEAQNDTLLVLFIVPLSLVALGVDLYLCGIKDPTVLEHQLFVVCLGCWLAGDLALVARFLGAQKALMVFLNLFMKLSKFLKNLPK